DRDQPAQQEAEDDSEHRHHGRLREADPEAQQVGAVAHPEHGDVRGEPRPHEVARLRRPLGLGDDLDAGGLDDPGAADGGGGRGGVAVRGCHVDSGGAGPAGAGRRRGRDAQQSPTVTGPAVTCRAGVVPWSDASRAHSALPDPGGDRAPAEPRAQPGGPHPGLPDRARPRDPAVRAAGDGAHGVGDVRGLRGLHRDLLEVRAHPDALPAPVDGRRPAHRVRDDRCGARPARRADGRGGGVLDGPRGAIGSADWGRARGVPSSVLPATGHTEWAMYVGFGAFPGICARYAPTRMRFRRQSMAGALLTVCVTIGAALARLGEPMGDAAASWTVLGVGSVVAGLAAAVVLRLGLKSGVALFPLCAVAAVASAPPAAPVWAAFLIAGACASLCVVLGLLGHWAGERHPGAGVQAATETWTRAQLGAEFGRFAVAAAIAGALGLASGLPFPYWAQIAAIAPLSAPGRTLQVERGLHRIIGTTLGIVTTAFLLSFPAQPWQLVVWVVVLQFLAEMYVLRNYSFALLFITPLSLLM